jgi:hypothetical protein
MAGDDNKGTPQPQSSVGIVMPSWKKSDYLESKGPYKWILNNTDDLFKQSQLVNIIAEKAAEVGVKNFKSLWQDYLTSLKPVRTSSLTRFTDQAAPMRCGDYECTDGGVTGWGQGGLVTVCTHPIMPVCRLVNIDTGEVSLEIAYSRGGKWRNAVFEKSVLASSQKIISLASCGIDVDTGKAQALVTYLSALENMNYNELPEIRNVGRLGWIDGYGFSPYVDNLSFAGDEYSRHIFECVRAGGRYEEWMRVAREVRSGKSVVARIMLAASFASVLVKPMNALPFIAHIWSSNAGTGKTVGLYLAASVWGSPAVGDYCKTFNASPVGYEYLEAFCGNLPLCLDELQCIKGNDRDTFDKMIFMLCEGSGKTRGARSGGLQRSTHWRNCTISTGNEPITRGNSGAGAINRVIEIDCKDEPLFENPRDVVEIITTNFGFAGKLFVEQLSNKEIMEIARNIQGAFAEQIIPKVEPKQALSASLILTADALAEMIVFNDGIALTAADIMPYLVTTRMANSNLRAYNWLTDTIASNPNKFGQNVHNDYQGECWGTIDDITGTAYIIKSHFDRIMETEGYNPTSFLSWAKRNGKLKYSEGRYTISKRLPGVKTVARCVGISVYLDEDDEPEVSETYVEPEAEADTPVSFTAEPVEEEPADVEPSDEAPTEPDRPQQFLPQPESSAAQQ